MFEQTHSATLEQLPSVENVLEDLVDGVAQVDFSVGVGRPVVKNEALLPPTVLLLPPVDRLELPRGDDLPVFPQPGLSLQASGEGRGRQEHRGAEVVWRGGLSKQGRGRTIKFDLIGAHFCCCS